MKWIKIIILGKTFPQLTGELYSVLSAIKKYYACFDVKDPTETHPTIKSSLAQWVKLDPESLQAPVFEDEEIEEFIAYAENTPENLVAKASALLYISCAGRKGELQEATWGDISQTLIDGKKKWTIAYHREKQADRPVPTSSVLGDEISNLAFSLYAGQLFQNK